MIKGIKKYGKADRRCDMGNYIVVWGIMLLLMCARNRLVLTDEDPAEYSPMENLIVTENHFKKSTVMLCTFHGIWMAFKQAIVKTYGDQDVAVTYGEFRHNTTGILRIHNLQL